MKSKQLEQIKNLLNIFEEKIINPKELTAIKVALISGKNKHPIEISIKENDGNYIYNMFFIGKSKLVNSEKFIETLINQISLYDGVEISFYERGGGKRIIADDRNVKITNIEALSTNSFTKETVNNTHLNQGVSEKRDYYIRIDEANELLKAIGILDEKNKVRNNTIRKYNQIDRFVELADPLLQEFIKRGETIKILDCACGKSYLSFVLNYYIKEKLGHPCEFLGLDWTESVISSSKELAAKLQYRNMNFIQCDLSQYAPLSFIPTICMSLHACDTATDLAIYTGIMCKAKAILCVPCCQKELLTSKYSIPALEKNILKHGLLKARFSDLMTDAMRVLVMEAFGYETTVIEYISPLDSPKNIMIKGRFTGKKNDSSEKEYKEIKKQFGCEIMLGKMLGM